MSNITLTIGGALDLNLRLPAPEGETIITTWIGDVVISGKGNEMAYMLPNDRQIIVAVSYVDAHENPAQVDGEVVWASSDETVLSVLPNPSDAQQCTIRPVGPAKAAQVTATADADLGTGVKTITTLMDITVLAGEAVAGTIAPVGDPQPIP